MLNMHIISESVLMMSTANYQNWFMLVEAIACQIWRVFFETQCSGTVTGQNSVMCCFAELTVPHSPHPHRCQTVTVNRFSTQSI